MLRNYAVNARVKGVYMCDGSYNVARYFRIPSALCSREIIQVLAHGLFADRLNTFCTVNCIRHFSHKPL
jgi:hypothetical protein